MDELEFTDMANEIATATSFTDLRDQLIRFLTGVLPVSYSLAGSNTNGANLTQMKLDTTAVTETWTLTVTSITPVTFSVVGSVTGATASASLDTDYDNGKIQFRIESSTYNGPEDFAVSDTYTIPVQAETFNTSTERWRVNRWDLDSGGGAGALGEVLYEGFGLAGTDNIFFSIKTYQNLSVPYNNWGMTGSIGFDPQELLSNQPGQSGETFILLDDVAMSYWFVATGRRWTMVAKLGSIYLHGTAGLFLPYGTPEQYPFPAFVGGTYQNGTTAFSLSNENHRAWWDPSSSCLLVRTPDGTWQQFLNIFDSSGNEANQNLRNVWPYQGCRSVTTRTKLKEIRDNLDGSYSLIPLILNMDSPQEQNLGEIEAVFYISGFNNTSEATFSIGGDNYVVFQNIFRLDRWHYMALRLD